LLIISETFSGLRAVCNRVFSFAIGVLSLIVLFMLSRCFEDILF